MCQVWPHTGIPHPPGLPQKCMFWPKTLYLGCLGATHHGLPHIIHVDYKGSSVRPAMVHPCAKCGLTLAFPTHLVCPKSVCFGLKPYIWGVWAQLTMVYPILFM